MHATRLPDEEEPARRFPPASTVILDRERIERSGARTLQDALAARGGRRALDQVGNDVQKTLDLRGFAKRQGHWRSSWTACASTTRGTTTRPWSSPARAVERIEITRGSAAALVGGGAEAGVIHVLTRAGRRARGLALRCGAGSDGGRRATGHAQGTLRSVEL